MTHFLGIHLDGQALRVTKLHINNKKVSIDLLRTLAKSDVTENVNPLYNLEIFQGKDHKIVTGLDSSEMFLRSLSIKLTEKKKVLSALPFQLEGIFPFPLEQALITPYIFKEDIASSKVQVLATQKSNVKEHIDKILRIGLDPDVISSVPSGLARYFSFAFPEESEGILFYFGARSSVAICLHKSALQYSYPFSFGIENLVDALSEDFKDLKHYEILEKAYSLDLASIDYAEAKATFECLFSLQKEIDRVLSYFQTKSVSKNITKIAVAGSFSFFSKFKDFFFSSLPKHLTILKTPSIGDYDEPTIESYAPTIGLCLDAALSDGMSLQLRQKEFSSKKLVKSRLKTLYTFYAGCALFTACMGLSFHLYLNQKEKTLKQLCGMYFPSALQKDDLDQEISHLEKRLSKDKSQELIAPSIHNVSDVLAWLSAHPKLIKQHESSSAVEFIDIKQMKYQMVKPPKLGAGHLPIAVKVELEFSSPSSRVARDFHEALLKGDHMVDPKKEISWSGKDSTYKTSFYLRQKRV